MAGYARHLRHQLPMLGALGGAALHTARQRIARARDGTDGGASALEVPGPLIRQVVPPRPRDLIDDYTRHVGGELHAYRGVVPAHMFPQWTFPVQWRALKGVPYPLARIVNAGCALQINGPLPDDEALEVTAQLVDVDDDGYRAVLRNRVITQTASSPEALVAEVQAWVPLRRRPRDGEAPRADHRVPADAEAIDGWDLDGRAGLAFALLTGDFNPIHWVAPYARLQGYGHAILHGFSTAARAMESLIRIRGGGRPQSIRRFDCRFTRPLVLPASPRVFVGGDSLWVADAPDTRAYLSGTFELRGDPS